MGLHNVIVMIPFCRTIDEAKRVLASMAGYGLRQHDKGLLVYAMCEIPSNVVLADDFLNIFDGYSIGSNDLTQLILGLDRDSGTVAHLFDERNPAVKALIAQAIEAAHRANKPIGICGQAPSDYPDFAAWLVEKGITSISLNPDTAVKTRTRISAAEAMFRLKPGHQASHRFRSRQKLQSAPGRLKLGDLHRLAQLGRCPIAKQQPGIRRQLVPVANYPLSFWLAP